MSRVAARLFRKRLLNWYERHRRDLPWRRTSDPYCIWISEIMLQQTRVAAVLPYYDRFLARFPDLEALAAAPEEELLTAWAGLGYYSRARNVQKAAVRMVELGGFPDRYEAIRELPGVGDYTAAAVGSIAFDLPYAAVDGNVLRVLSRVSAEPGDLKSPKTRSRLSSLAQDLLEQRQPGNFNQAMMELGATICLPAQPQCLLCPIAEFCEARRSGKQAEFPIKARKGPNEVVERRILWIEKKNSLLLWKRPPESKRMAGFWELPEASQLLSWRVGKILGRFRHTIVNTNYRFEVVAASISVNVLREAGPAFAWHSREKLHELPLSTTAKKAIVCSIKQEQVS